MVYFDNRLSCNRCFVTHKRTKGSYTHKSSTHGNPKFIGLRVVGSNRKSPRDARGRCACLWWISNHHSPVEGFCKRIFFLWTDYLAEAYDM